MRTITEKEKIRRKYCQGCYNNIYNNSTCNPSGTSECWSLDNAVVIWRKEVHVDQIPPWEQKAKRLPNCYRKQRYVYVSPNQTR